jgi:lipoate-protein ligase A
LSERTSGPVWFDLGSVDAKHFHALYAGMAATTAEDDPPKILWLVNGTEHISVGAAQDAGADLDIEYCRAKNLPIQRRPLGGGAIWLSARQPCFMVILPRCTLSRGHRHLFALGTGLAVNALRHLGLEAVTTRGQDVCVGGRKIMGTGAATVREGCVFGASFLCRFPVESFVSCLNLSGDGYRAWVMEAMRDGVTDIERESGKPPPDVESVRRAVWESVRQRFGVDPLIVKPGNDDIDRWIQIGSEEISDLELGDLGPMVTSGIRINRASHVFQTFSRCGELRVHVDGAGIRRVWCEEPRIQQILEECIVGLVPERLVLRARLNHVLDSHHADEVSWRIDTLYRGIRNR